MGERRSFLGRHQRLAIARHPSSFYLLHLCNRILPDVVKPRKGRHQRLPILSAVVIHVLRIDRKGNQHRARHLVSQTTAQRSGGWQCALRDLPRGVQGLRRNSRRARLLEEPHLPSELPSLVGQQQEHDVSVLPGGDTRDFPAQNLTVR